MSEFNIGIRTKKSIIFENQELIGKKINNTFQNRKIVNIMVISKTQSGKTGSMCATIKEMLNDTNNLIPTENIYIITGLSSCEWKEQTKERMPNSINKNVFHRGDLNKINKFVNDIKDKNNILIIMDEIQIAVQTKQTIYNTFKKAGLLDIQQLYLRDIKILEYTATPDGTIYDLMKWKHVSVKILGNVGNGYVSSYKLYELNKIKQFKNLDDPKNILEIKMDIDNYNNNYLYHIIRIKTGNDILILLKIFLKLLIIHLNLLIMIRKVILLILIIFYVINQLNTHLYLLKKC
jgi:hypothetical protein